MKGTAITPLHSLRSEAQGGKTTAQNFLPSITLLHCSRISTWAYVWYRDMLKTKQNKW